MFVFVAIAVISMIVDGFNAFLACVINQVISGSLSDAMEKHTNTCLHHGLSETGKKFIGK